MQKQLKNMRNIQSHRINAVTSANAQHLVQQNDWIKPNGFQIVVQNEHTNQITYQMHKKKLYTYKELACLLSHLQALEIIASGREEWAIVAEDDVRFLPNFSKNLLTLIEEAPQNWEILQLYTNNDIVRQHGTKLNDVQFIHWLPHHWSTMLYVIRKSTAADILNSIKIQGKFVFPDENVLVSDEFLYWKHVTYTHTKGNLVEREERFESSIQLPSSDKRLSPPLPQHESDKAKNHIEIKRPLTSTLLIYTVFTVETRRELDVNLQQLKLEIQTMNDFYQETKKPHWIVVIGVHNDKDMAYVRSNIKTISHVVTFDVQPLESNTNNFNKWKYIQTYIPLFKKYDHVLINNFQQRLTGFPWRTFLQPKSTSILAQPIRESLYESMPFRWYHIQHKHFWYHINDASWWRRKEPNAFLNLTSFRRPYVESWFVVVDGQFASWLLSQIFVNREWVDKANDFSVDSLWCGAAQQWITERNLEMNPCVVVPVVSFHSNDHNSTTAPQTREETEPVQEWRKNKTFVKWLLWSWKWRQECGGHRPIHCINGNDQKFFK